MIQFQESDLYLNLTDPELEYRRRNDEDKTSVHHGQRKLLLTVVEFLTLYWDPAKYPKPKLVYSGAAPGVNIQIISDLFPEFEFHLYDPSPFKIRASERVKLYNQYFTDEDAKFWENKNVYFISDIRTADYTKAKDLDENEEQIMKDMMDQMRWYNIINPIKAHLKFRLPYTGGNRPTHIKYLDGVLFKQVFAPETSTETRLVPHSPGLTKDWDCLKYQSQMFYHNAIVRESKNYLNPLDNSENLIDYPELTNDYDSTCEIWILTKYLKLRNTFSSDGVKKLSRTITKKLSDKRSKQITLEFLRKNPRYIKEQNMKPLTRDNLPKNF